MGICMLVQSAHPGRDKRTAVICAMWRPKDPYDKEYSTPSKHLLHPVSAHHHAVRADPIPFKSRSVVRQPCRPFLHLSHSIKHRTTLICTAPPVRPSVLFAQCVISYVLLCASGHAASGGAAQAPSPGYETCTVDMILPLISCEHRQAESIRFPLHTICWT